MNPAYCPEVQAKRRKTFESKRTALIFYQEPRVNKIDGHSLSVIRVDKRVADKWLALYHPFGAPRGNVLCLGLADDSQIYCMMTFKKSRNPAHNVELSRMWMLPKYHVIDGYDILSSEAVNFGVSNVVAYVNMSFENCLDYESIGMKYKRSIQPTRWWITPDHRMSDASRRQRMLSTEFMLSNGWLPVYDCGQHVYVFD
jgi:hypothetical protein